MRGFQLKNGKQTFQRSGQHQTTLRFVSTDPMKNRFFNYSKKIQAFKFSVVAVNRLVDEATECRKNMLRRPLEEKLYVEART